MAGWLLVLGSLSFIVGAANPALGQVWSAPLDDQLRLIHGAATAWTSVAASFDAGSSIDPTYITMNLWAEGLFGAFTYLVGGSLVVLGVAIVRGGSLSQASGWFAILIGCGIALGYAILGDMPPFVAYLPTGVLGVVVVRTRA